MRKRPSQTRPDGPFAENAPPRAVAIGDGCHLDGVDDTGGRDLEGGVVQVARATATQYRGDRLEESPTPPHDRGADAERDPVELDRGGRSASTAGWAPGVGHDDGSGWSRDIETSTSPSWKAEAASRAGAGEDAEHSAVVRERLGHELGDADGLALRPRRRLARPRPWWSSAVTNTTSPSMDSPLVAGSRRLRGRAGVARFCSTQMCACLHRAS